MIIKNAEEMILIVRFSETDREIHRRITIVKPSMKRPRRSRCGPTPRRFINLFMIEGILLFFN